MKSIIVLLTALALTACTNLKPTSTERVQVYKSDQSRQCAGSGIDPETMQQELKGIPVYQAEKSQLNDVMFLAVCGNQTGNINVYTIDAKYIKQAEKVGFTVLKAKNPK